MIQNYLKIAWRNILHNKVYSALNILGLAAGMAVALIIALWVNYQYSFDKLLPNRGQLYQVRRNFNSNGDTLTFSSTSLKLADALRNHIPEIKYVAETDQVSSHGLTVGDKKLYIDGFMAGGDFLKMFGYPVLQGDAGLSLKDPYSIVLTESAAKALFGSVNVINKMVRFDNRDNLKVTAILKDVPANSTFQFKYIVPFSYYEIAQPWVKQARTEGFDDNSFWQFVELNPEVTYGQVAPKIKNIEKTENSVNAQNSNVILQPVSEWHLFSDYTNGKATDGLIRYVRIFGIIGALVLLIACINFVNLSTALSDKRAREVGVRKAIGSQRRDLIFQFLTESVLITFIAFLFCLLFVQLALQAFNTLASTVIAIPYGSIGFWLIMMVSVLFTALLAGGRPAFYLSSFNPVKVLKGNLKIGRSASTSRRILVVAQFSCSIALIISTVIIYRQIQFAKDRPTGYSINRLMTTDVNEDLGKNYPALKNELLQSGVVDAVTTATSPATGVYSHGNIDHWPGKYAGETIEMGFIFVSGDYLKTLGMHLQSGRDFLVNSTSDTSSVIFNEAAISRMRIKNPINQVINKNGKQYRIVGVVKDALMASPYSHADPTAFVYGNGWNLLYRLSPHVKTHEAVSKLTAIFNKYNPAFPYTYRFVDDDYNRKFDLEVLIGKLSGIFAVLAIFISCLGLFGLAAYIAEQRTKEIGIRKVLGASVSQVWVLLSKDFILLVTISCVIASPIAFYFLHGWLQHYDYHIEIGAGVFIVSAVVAILITLVTISFQAIKAAIANPVKSLRSE